MQRVRRGHWRVTLFSVLLLFPLWTSNTAFAQKKAPVTPSPPPRYTVETVEDFAAVRDALFPNGALRRRLQALPPNVTFPLAGDNATVLQGGNRMTRIGASFVDTLGMAAVFLPGEGLVKALLYHPVVWTKKRDDTVASDEPVLPTFPPVALPLPPNCNRGVAVATNASGQIIGQVGYLVIQNAPSVMNGRIIAYGSIGRAGQSTQYPCDTNPRSILWTPDGRILPIPCLSGDLRCRADDINTQGEIVGGSCRADLKGFRAVLWRHGDPIDLNRCVTLKAGESLYEATFINDKGQILAVCTHNGRFVRRVLLTPKTN